MALRIPAYAQVASLSLFALSACAQPVDAPGASSAAAPEGSLVQTESQALTVVPSDRTEFSRDAIENVMPVAGADYPERLRGLFWLDGIQIADIAATFAGASWDPATRTAYVDVSGNHTWAFDGTPEGQALYDFCRLVHLHYRVQFNEDFTSGRATPVLDFSLLSLNVPNFVTDFTLKYQSEGVWLRETHLFRGPPSFYTFRRILEGDGTHTPVAFDKYLKEAKPAGYVFTKP